MTAASTKAIATNLIAEVSPAPLARVAARGILIRGHARTTGCGFLVATGPARRSVGERQGLAVVGAHLCAAARKPGARPRPRLGTLASGPLLLDGRRLGRLRLLLIRGEDLILGLALEQGDELVGLDRLALEQDPGDRVELLAVLGEDVLRSLVRVLDHPADLVVDLAGDLVGVVGLR